MSALASVLPRLESRSLVSRSCCWAVDRNSERCPYRLWKTLRFYGLLLPLVCTNPSAIAIWGNMHVGRNRSTLSERPLGLDSDAVSWTTWLDLLPKNWLLYPALPRLTAMTDLASWLFASLFGAFRRKMPSVNSSTSNVRNGKTKMAARIHSQKGRVMIDIMCVHTQGHRVRSRDRRDCRIHLDASNRNRIAIGLCIWSTNRNVEISLWS